MSNLNDIVGNANLFNGNNFGYTFDRFNNSNSSIYLNSGYLQVPSGVYFSGDFTITVWCNYKEYQSWSRIIEFANGAPTDNVIFAFAQNGISLYAAVHKGTVYGNALVDGSKCYNYGCSTIVSHPSIKLNQWYHLAFVLKDTTGYLYLNGDILVKSNDMSKPNNVNRTRNYIGHNNWDGYNSTNAIFDDLKIYQGAMSSEQIANDYEWNKQYSSEKTKNEKSQSFEPNINSSDEMRTKIDQKFINLLYDNSYP